jgi:hypothetical protein
MQPAQPNQKSLLKRQIPTILGLTVLVIALVSGLIFFSQGTGVFAPRATPQTTPKSIQVSNVTDTGFTVSFLTDESTPGFIKYGTEATALNSQASDDRDQLSGSVGSFTLHHITVRGLQPNTQYHYTMGTGTQAQFDNQGSPFVVKTAQRAGSPSAAKTIYGNVLNESGGPAEGSIVYITMDGVGMMSSLVKGSGSWAVPLSNARKIDGSGYAEVSDSSELSIRIQGPTSAQTAQISTTVAQAQPVESLSFGQTTSKVSDTTTAAPVDEEVSTTDTDEETDDTTGVGGDDNLASTSAQLASATTASSSATTTASSSAVVDLTKTTAQTVSTSQPTITGKAVPNVVVNITVNSDTQITQQLTTDANGNFVLDISQLEDELEPGTHTVTYSYVDPTTGKTVTKTQTFTVKGTSTQLASATTTTTSSSSATVPFGSGNPVSIGGATQSATATKSATVSARTSQPSTGSGIPVSGSVGTTLALIIGGLFFTITGAWSFWVSQQLKEDYVQE